MPRSTRLLWLLFFFCLACQHADRQGLAARVAVPGWPDRDDLVKTLREKGRILVVFPASVDGYGRVAGELSSGGRRGVRFEARPDTEVTEQELQEEVLLLLGTPASNAVLARMAGRLPFRFGNGVIGFNGRTFDHPATVVNLSFFPNPLAPANPILMTAGLTDTTVLAHLQADRRNGFAYGWSSLGYEVYIEERRVLMGLFDDRNWLPDPEIAFDFSAATDTVLSSRHFLFLARRPAPADSLVATLQNQYETAASRIESFTGKIAPTGIPVYLYASAEEKGLELNDTHRTQIDFEKQEIHTVLSPVYAGIEDGTANRLLLRGLLGQPQIAALELGLAVLFTDKWQGYGFNYWAAQLNTAGAAPSLTYFLDNENLSSSSDLLLPPLAAVFVKFLVDTWGRELFLERYASWAPSPEEVIALEIAWRNHLANALSPSSAVPLSSPPPPFLRGFNFAHEGYSIYNGYGSRLATTALAKLSGMCANAVAIIPYSFLRDPHLPAAIPLISSPGGENDESVIHSAAMAREMGMTTVLKPQIWLGGGRWPGDIEMKTEADWHQFFQHYTNWILHYAVLAEVYRIDVLCIGTELVKTTATRAGDWRQLIHQIRQVYSGRLTYAANWGDEFENLPFWDALDFMGLNCYYPLSDHPNATDKELRANFRRTLDKVARIVKRYDRPLLFTEIGFPSMKAPWLQPHDDRREVPYDAEDQARCYRIVFEEIQHRSWCHGILWWKYPSNPTTRHERGFTPMNKPAEKIVAEWFGKMGGK